MINDSDSTLETYSENSGQSAEEKYEADQLDYYALIPHIEEGFLGELIEAVTQCDKDAVERVLEKCAESHSAMEFEIRTAYWEEVAIRIKTKQKEVQEQINSQVQEIQSDQDQLTMFLLIIKWIEKELQIENKSKLKETIELEPLVEKLNDPGPLSTSRP